MIKIKLKKEGKIIALEGGKQVGYLNYNHPSDKSRKRNLEIEWVYVLPKYRRKGLGSLMINFLLDSIKKKNIVWLSLWTSEDIEKDNAVEFYKKLGFKKLTTQKDYYKKGVATTLFAKRLRR